MSNKPTPQSLGGQAVVKKYGRDYMSQIGRKGYQSTCDRYFDGDEDAMNKWLAAKGLASMDETYAQWGFNYFTDPGPHPAHIQDGNS